MASLWLTSAASVPDSLSSVSNNALVVSVYSFASVGRLGVRDHEDAARHLQAVPGIPGVDGKSNHDAERGGENDGLQQRGYGQTVQHDAPPKAAAIWGEKGEYLGQPCCRINGALRRFGIFGRAWGSRGGTEPA